MKYLSLLALLALCVAQSSSARPHPWHFIKTHKELLTSDALLMAAMGADAASSVHCQRYPAYCLETNGLLGPHPDQLNTWTYALGLGAAMVTADHLIWHYAPEKGERHLYWFPTAPVIIGEYFNVKSNVRGTEKIQACYHDGLCK